MKITKHLTFYYVESRMCYINNIIDETNTYEYQTDIYIHTNNPDLHENMFHTYTNGHLELMYHDLSNDWDPFFLTWKCRYFLQKQKNDYDVFMYMEGDILIPFKAIRYWLTYNEKLIGMNYNLGFLRIEMKENIEYITDLHGVQFDTIIEIDGNKYCVNNINPYCAFWIYNKKEFHRFVNSVYYNICNIRGYGVPESSAVGLHGLWTHWYKNTLIPIINNKLIDDCKIYHLPNNFTLTNDLFATIKFDEAIKE
jgi:hypothetical protein